MEKLTFSGMRGLKIPSLSFPESVKPRTHSSRLLTRVGGEDPSEPGLADLSDVGEDRSLHEADGEAHDAEGREEHGRRRGEVDEQPADEDREVNQHHRPFPSDGVQNDSG